MYGTTRFMSRMEYAAPSFMFPQKRMRHVISPRPTAKITWPLNVVGEVV